MNNDDDKLDTFQEELHRFLPKVVRQEVMVFLLEVERGFSFLETWGFKRYASNCSSEVTPFCVRVVFYSMERDREVEISFLPQSGGASGREAVSVTIWKDLENKGNRGWKATLRPKVFLRELLPEFDISRLEPTSYNGGIEDRLKRCLSVWVEVLTTELRTVVLGDEWVAGMYVTPFD